MNIKSYILNRINDIKNIIYNLPIGSEKKLFLHKNLRFIIGRLAYYGEKYVEEKKNLTFCCSNFFYGHEYWLKHYSGYTDYIYGMIEHGIYFGQDRTKIGEEAEWDIGSILTYGEDRIKLLRKLYPDYNVVGIGPRIHYAETDLDYLNELKGKLIPNSKTIALYPSHSLFRDKSCYNVKAFLARALEVAKDIDAHNILVSLHPADIANGMQKEFLAEDSNIILVTGGKNQLNFLPRLRAIFTVTDLIYTNDIGTHVGYSVYFDKPNIIDYSTNNNNYSDIYLEELHHFSKVFDGTNPTVLTAEQKELCDYYFGYSYIKTPEEVYKELERCKQEFRKRFK